MVAITRNPFAVLSDDDLAVMTDRAYREAARCWQEARSADASARQMLVMAAESADAYWRDLRDQQDYRLADLAGLDEVRSTDGYTVQPTRPAIVTSAVVQRAQAGDLPGKAVR